MTPLTTVGTRGRSGRRGRVTIALLLASTSVLGFGSAEAVAVSGTVPVPPAGKAYFGTYTPPTSSWSIQDQENAYLNLERSLGRTLDIAQLFYGWNASFPTWWESWQVSSGRIPLIAWSGYDTDAVGNGSQDAIIKARADAVKTFGQPVFIRWGSEMDGSASTTWVKSPASFITAWRHIYTVFHNRGATNATFAWCPTAWGFQSGAAAKYYPGDAYVDWICTDGYNWAPGRPNTKWRSLSEIFQAFYTWSMPHGKPLMIAEYGCQEGASGQKAAWFSAAQSSLKTQFPGIKAVVYFDTFRTYDWRVATTTSSLAAFKTMSLDPYFNP